VFILGSPRSGTTLLFETLAHSPRLGALPGESHLLWEMFHPIDRARPGRVSHEVGPEDVTPRERRVLYWAIDRIADGRRYLDKAPRNCLRVPYLAELFPGAWFVHLRRDGRAAVSSLITGWRSPGTMFPGTPMPVDVSIEGYDGNVWKFLFPPGWEAYATGHTLAEVCAFQWVAANQAILDAREAMGEGRWVDVRYEEFVEAPVDNIGRVLDRLGVPRDPAVLDAAGLLDHRVTKAITPPSADKWRRENPEEIASVLPAIDPMMRRLGYDPGA
jgi:hypothetical protein